MSRLRFTRAMARRRDLKDEIDELFADLWQVSRLSGAPPDEVFRFFAHGMLLNIITALDLPAIASGNPVISAWVAEHQH